VFNQTNWNVQQLEALAIIWACETLRAYIIGSKVLIKTDHKSLEWIKQSKVPRLVRWACRLEEYDYEIEYQPGKYNKSEQETITKHRKYPGIEVNYDLSNVELEELNILQSYKIDGIEAEKFKLFQHSDIEIQKLISKDGNAIKKLKILEEINGIIYKKVNEQLLLLLPKQLVNHVLQQYHNHALGGHRARDRLYETLRTRFFWISMYKDVKNYVNSCELCLKIKTRAPVSNGLLKPIVTKRPFELIGIDIAYLPLSKGGYRYVLVAIDYFTNWLEAALLKSMSAEEVIRAFFKIIIA
jgi:hypothetical protein